MPFDAAANTQVAGSPTTAVGLVSYLPREAWALVLLLGGVAIGSLLLPYDLVAARLGLRFEVFFVLVSTIQLVTALGIGAVVVHYRTAEGEESEWRYD